MKIGDSVEKINIPGKASCNLCHSVINYGGRGKGALKEHLNSDTHFKKLKMQRTNYDLGSFSGKKDKLFPLFSQTKSKPSSSARGEALPPPCSSSTISPDKPIQPPRKPTTPLVDRVATMEAMILSVMAENSMPLTFAPVLVDIARACSLDPKALAHVKLSPASAAFKLKYGLAQTILQSLVADLKVTPFSLNVDEATSSNNKKVLTVLVSFYKGPQIFVHHLASVEIMKADSETIFKAICQIFEEHDLPWENLVSVLFDSCAVMRGHLSGVETRIREEKAPHLLNIDGDSCHHMNNVAKQFCSPFQKYLESMFMD